MGNYLKGLKFIKGHKNESSIVFFSVNYFLSFLFSAPALFNIYFEGWGGGSLCSAVPR